MELSREEAALILDLFTQWDNVKSPEDIYKIRIPIITTYVLRKKLEEFIGQQ